MVRTVSRKFFGKGAPNLTKEGYKGETKASSPILFGNTFSSSNMFCAQFIKASTYSGAGNLVGRLYLTPSSHKYSYLPSPGQTTYHKMNIEVKTNRGPEDMIGHSVGVN